MISAYRPGKADVVGCATAAAERAAGARVPWASTQPETDDGAERCDAVRRHASERTVRQAREGCRMGPPLNARPHEGPWQAPPSGYPAGYASMSSPPSSSARDPRRLGSRRLQRDVVGRYGDRVRDRRRPRRGELEGDRRDVRGSARVARCLGGLQGQGRRVPRARRWPGARARAHEATQGRGPGRHQMDFENVLLIRDGKVLRLSLHADRDRALADLGLTGDGGG